MQLSWVDIEKKFEESITFIARDNVKTSWTEFMLKLQIAAPDVVAAYEAAFDEQGAKFSASNQLTRKVIELLIKLLVQTGRRSTDARLFLSFAQKLYEFFTEEDFTAVWSTIADISLLFAMIDNHLKAMTLGSCDYDATRVLHDIKAIVSNRIELKIKPYEV